MKKILFIIAVLITSSSFSQQEEINWIDFEALDTALEKEVKPVLIYFYTDWCVYCKKMEKNAFKNSEVISELNEKFYAVRMNAESTDAIEFDGQIFTNEQAKNKRNGIHQIPLLLASRNKMPFSLPAIILLDKNFKATARYFEYLTTQQLKSAISSSYPTELY